MTRNTSPRSAPRKIGLSLTILTILCMVICVVSGRADVTFFDGTFNDPDWELITFTSGPGGTISASQQLSGGNPGAYRDIVNSVHAGGSPQNRANIWGFHGRI